MNVVMHIGAHRTGTTSVQMCLAENLARLAEAGWVYWGPPVTRTAPLAKLIKNTRAGRQSGDMRTAQLQIDQISEMINEVASAGRNLLISDENIAGTMPGNLMRASLYARAKLRLRIFSRLFKGHTLTTYFTIRDTADYWRSAHAYMDRRASSDAPESFGQRVLESHRNWLDVVNDLAKGQGHGRLVVLPYQPDHDPRALVHDMLGEAFDTPLRLSQAAHNRSEVSPNILSYADQALLGEAYARDLAAMPRLPRLEKGSALIEFQPNGPALGTRNKETI